MRYSSLSVNSNPRQCEILRTSAPGHYVSGTCTFMRKHSNWFWKMFKRVFALCDFLGSRLNVVNKKLMVAKREDLPSSPAKSGVCWSYPPPSEAVCVLGYHQLFEGPLRLTKMPKVALCASKGPKRSEKMFLQCLYYTLRDQNALE